MQKNSAKTFLHCSHSTAGTFFIGLGVLFAISGCAQLYRAVGLTDEQAQEQVAQDQDSRQQIIEQVRWTTHEILTTSLAAAGSILSGLLARWLGTERKITAAMITGIEATESPEVKKAINAKATAAGVEPALHRRVVALT